MSTNSDALIVRLMHRYCLKTAALLVVTDQENKFSDLFVIESVVVVVVV